MTHSRLRQFLIMALICSISSPSWAGFRLSELKTFIEAGGAKRTSAILYMHGMTLGVISEVAYLHRVYDPVYGQAVRDIKEGRSAWLTDDLKKRLGTLVSSQLCFPEGMQIKALQGMIEKWIDRYADEILESNPDADAYLLIKIGLGRNFSCVKKRDGGSGDDAYDEDEEYEAEPDTEPPDGELDDGLDAFEESDGYG